MAKYLSLYPITETTIHHVSRALAVDNNELGERDIPSFVDGFIIALGLMSRAPEYAHALMTELYATNPRTTANQQRAKQRVRELAERFPIRSVEVEL